MRQFNNNNCCVMIAYFCGICFLLPYFYFSCQLFANLFTAACYEIPTCHDQRYMDFWDSHPVGAQLFKMTFPYPKYHFPVDFRPDWQRLTWTMGPGDTDLAEAALDSDTGKLIV